jgi:signal transduction histidine kinase
MSQAAARRYTPLHVKALLIVATTIVGLLGVIYLPLRAFVLGSFTELERQATSTDVDRAHRAIDDELNQLDTYNASFAIWDDTYAFVTDRNDSYIQKNLYDQFFVDSRLSLVLVVDSSGKLVFGKAFDLASRREVALPPRFMRLAAHDPLIDNIEPTRSITGIVLLPKAPMMIASHPIVTSEGRGPPRGTMLMGRYLDSEEIARLAEQTRLQLAIWQPGADEPAEIRAARAAVPSAAQPLVQPLSEQTVAGSTLLDDLDSAGKPLLRVTTPRNVYAQGQAGVQAFMVSLLVAVLVFGAVVLALFERFILSRIAALSASVQRIGAEGDLSQRVAMRGDDELADLALSINGMLLALEQARLEQQQAQEVREKMLLQDEALRTKREFISIVSHELRTPLTPITGYAELMLLGEGGDLTADQRAFLETIRTNAVRMTSLVDDLLEIGRIETNRLALNLAPTDLRATIAATLALLQPEIKRSQLALAQEIDPALPEIQADERRIGQVLTNLISNAIKYNRARGRIAIRAFQDGAGFVTVQVEDSGIGLAPEQVAQLFTPFYRAETPLRDKVRGSGLGLAIAKSFVELHGGKIWVRSEPGAGSVFTFTLPIRR